ncbi:hypothetical protein SAY87_024886 [Trapa incisa]|uniref:Uncharacterized protein n=1 Tax=Trapa incisa TaxID=236973 RepID=A0AAN7GCR8_9MYRT|nr:hypothetical protein SAY87_024886 [Trapa incisa]
MMPETSPTLHKRATRDHHQGFETTFTLESNYAGVSRSLKHCLGPLILAIQSSRMKETNLFVMALAMNLLVGAHSWRKQFDPCPVSSVPTVTCVDCISLLLEHLIYGVTVDSIFTNPIYKWLVICAFIIVMMLADPSHQHLWRGVRCITVETYRAGYSATICSLVRLLAILYGDQTVMNPREDASAGEADGVDKV